jgi:hypothetical protein
MRVEKALMPREFSLFHSNSPCTVDIYFPLLVVEIEKMHLWIWETRSTGHTCLLLVRVYNERRKPYYLPSRLAVRLVPSKGKERKNACSQSCPKTICSFLRSFTKFFSKKVFLSLKQSSFQVYIQEDTSLDSSRKHLPRIQAFYSRFSCHVESRRHLLKSRGHVCRAGHCHF